MNRGIPVVISAPSGGGKTSLCHWLLDTDRHCVFSVSYTTRMPRRGEQHGVDYHFVDEAQFLQQVQQGFFLEYAKVHDRYYGTGAKVTQDLLAQGKTVLFDIDVQGGEQIVQQLPQALLIFLLPPSLSELKKRLLERQRDSVEELERRLQKVPLEIEQARFYDYFLINDAFAQTAKQLQQIVEVERWRRQDKATIVAQVMSA